MPSHDNARADGRAQLRRIDFENLWRQPAALVHALDRAGLEPQYREGQAIKSLCPECREREAFTYPPTVASGAPVLYCNRRNKCGHRAPVWRLLCAAIGVSAATGWARGLSTRATVAPHKVAPSVTRMPRAARDRLWLSGQRLVHPDEPLDVVPADPRRAAALALLRSKHCEPAELALLDLVRLLPENVGAPGWPPSRSRDWPLVVELFDATGTALSIHGRALDPNADPKTMCPSGVGGERGLVFACHYARALLRGDPGVMAELGAVVITEGLTDFLAAAWWAWHRRATSGEAIAVIGIKAGSEGAMAEIGWPDRAVRVRIATDPDLAGDGYFTRILAALRRNPTGARVRTERMTLVLR